MFLMLQVISYCETMLLCVHVKVLHMKCNSVVLLV